MSKIIELHNVTKEFSTGSGAVRAVDNISLDIDKGAFVSIVGKSGSGKTTLLSLLGGLDTPTSGGIIVDGTDISKMSDHQLIRYRSRSVGFVFQAYNLIPNLTALDNVLLAMETSDISHAQRKPRALLLLSQVGITSDEAKRKPGRLSGGQQQRIAIARALANKPKVIFADEPTGNLDEENSQLIINLLHDLATSGLATIVLVTHDMATAHQTDAIIRLKDGKVDTSHA